MTQSAESRSPCRRTQAGDEAAPTIRMAGALPRCARRRFRAHFRVADASRMREVAVRLDGGRIATSRHKRLSARIPADRLRAGRHTIAVTAIDAAGNRSERSFAFRRCAR